MAALYSEDLCHTTAVKSLMQYNYQKVDIMEAVKRFIDIHGTYHFENDIPFKIYLTFRSLILSSVYINIYWSKQKSFRLLDFIIYNEDTNISRFFGKWYAHCKHRGKISSFVK